MTRDPRVDLVFALRDDEIGAITTGGPFGHPPTSKYDKLIALAKEVPPASTVVVHPCDEAAWRAE